MTIRDRIGTLLLLLGVIFSALLVAAVFIGFAFLWAHLVGLS